MTSDFDFKKNPPSKGQKDKNHRSVYDASIGLSKRSWKAEITSDSWSDQKVVAKLGNHKCLEKYVGGCVVSRAFVYILQDTFKIT